MHVSAKHSPLHSRQTNGPAPSALSAIVAANVAADSVVSPLSASLVKEYLAARGLEKTLDAFKLEFLQIQKSPTVSSRQELAEQLGIVKLVRQNKAQDQPLKTHLEVIVKHLVAHAQRDVPTVINNPSPKTSRPSSSKNRPTTTSNTPTNLKQKQEPLDAAASVAFRTPLGGFSATNPRAVSASASRNVSSAPPSRPGTSSFPSSDMRDVANTGETTELEGFMPSRRARPSTASVEAQRDTPVADDVQVTDDLEEDEYSLSSDVGIPLSASKLGASVSVAGTLITTQKATLLRKLIFPGTMTGGEESRARMTFTEEWKGKGFCFNTVSDLAYGLVQIKGGPCGLLAAVQAYVLKYLVFVDKAHNLRSGKLRPGKQECQAALVDAFSEILWQAGGTRHRRAVVAIYNPNLRANPGGNLQREKYISDGITENMELFEFFDSNGLKAFLNANISTFTVNDPNRHGFIQFLYSAILSRGPDTIREDDFDELDCSMIGRHGYCTQEMVNLILIGQAVSNVHDGDFKLGEGIDVKILKGIKKTSQFGYLSLFEHYGSLKVGEYMKTPQLPIFVVCSESHYTVLFSLERGLLTRPIATIKTSFTSTNNLDKFTLYYYDGLANQDNEIALDIVLVDSKRTSSLRDSSSNADVLVPPLELVLRTKWPDITRVSWIGSEPLL
ncbi:hypothetical protein BC830DRAFT_1131677 [Chytriomyces sp. MP71]|nr:hypothetical protein BC830DRAFT_1131677 [Chytriomyces sp. MP71]